MVELIKCIRWIQMCLRVTWKKPGWVKWMKLKNIPHRGSREEMSNIYMLMCYELRNGSRREEVSPCARRPVRRGFGSWVSGPITIFFLDQVKHYIFAISFLKNRMTFVNKRHIVCLKTTRSLSVRNGSERVREILRRKFLNSPLLRFQRYFR